MSEIVERVTLALCCGRVNPCPEGECCKAHIWEPEARRAIAAMREPTAGMTAAADMAMFGRVVEGDRRHAVLLDGYRAMIDAAMKD